MAIAHAFRSKHSTSPAASLPFVAHLSLLHRLLPPILPPNPPPPPPHPRIAPIRLLVAGNGSLELWKYSYPMQRRIKEKDGHERGVLGTVELHQQKTFSTQVKASCTVPPALYVYVCVYLCIYIYIYIYTHHHPLPLN